MKIIKWFINAWIVSNSIDKIVMPGKIKRYIVYTLLIAGLFFAILTFIYSSFLMLSVGVYIYALALLLNLMDAYNYIKKRLDDE